MHIFLLKNRSASGRRPAEALSRKMSHFQRTIWRYYRVHGRHTLPWRPPTLRLRRGKTNEFVYKILVSEVMLQQTQVERVIPFYAEFTKRFPTAKKLAAAPLSEVLKTWQGLGYNRRAKMLHDAAKKLLVRKIYSVGELEALPGVGPYTARAVAAFAYNQDVVFVETNIHTAITHHFFANKKKVSDKEIEEVLVQILPRGRAREWYSALMDYGAYLKKSGIKLNAKQAKYTKQKKFAGSLREARGAILHALASGSRTQTYLINLFGPSRRTQMREAQKALQSEGLIKRKKNHFKLAD